MHSENKALEFCLEPKLRRLVLVGAESHVGHAALAATVKDPPHSPQPNEPAAPAHDLESSSESDTESLGMVCPKSHRNSYKRQVTQMFMRRALCRIIRSGR